MSGMQFIQGGPDIPDEVIARFLRFASCSSAPADGKDRL